MKIKHIGIWRKNLKNKRPYTIAFKTINEVYNAFVAITLDNGIVGMGAANPSEYVVGESLSQCMEALSEENTAFLIGRDIRQITQLLFEILSKFPDNPSARAALDIAIHDAFTQYLQVPLSYYLGKKFDALPTSVTIGIKAAKETLEEANDYYKSGFKILKIKLGRDMNEDIERLQKIKERFGNKVKIRVDANQAYSYEQTIGFFEKIRGMDIELVEQPMAAKATAAMRALPAEVKRIVAADESLISPKDALHLINTEKACGIFNIKLMKCGGISQALKIADIAISSGVKLMWGCNDESRISISAALHTALSCPATKYIDLDGSFDLLKDVVSGGFVLKDGYMSVIDSPGLGLKREY